jgi:anti-anti-sigma regulatory factor
VKNAPTATRQVVVAAAPVTSVDVTAADILIELVEALRDGGIELRFAELKGPVKDKLRRFGLLTQFGEAAFFPTVEAAGDGYLRTSGRAEIP